MTDIPDEAVRAAIAEHSRLLIDRPEPTVLSDMALFRRVLEAALPHLSPAAPDLTGVPWRVGRKNPRNMYAAVGGEWEAHPPIGALDTPELSEAACGAHNEALARRKAGGGGDAAAALPHSSPGSFADLAWLLDTGVEVRIAPCADGMLVTLFDGELQVGDPVITGSGESPGDALAVARLVAEVMGMGDR